jgi:hypothetical protein
MDGNFLLDHVFGNWKNKSFSGGLKKVLLEQKSNGFPE